MDESLKRSPPRILGTDIYVYGASGPTYGSFSISVDNQTVTGSAYSAQEGVPYLLYYKNGLASDVQHILNITNLGPVNAGEGNTTLLDYIQTTIELAPAGYVHALERLPHKSNLPFLGGLKG